MRGYGIICVRLQYTFILTSRKRRTGGFIYFFVLRTYITTILKVKQLFYLFERKTFILIFE